MPRRTLSASEGVGGRTPEGKRSRDWDRDWNRNWARQAAAEPKKYTCAARVCERVKTRGEREDDDREERESERESAGERKTQGGGERERERERYLNLLRDKVFLSGTQTQTRHGTRSQTRARHGTWISLVTTRSSPEYTGTGTSRYTILSTGTSTCTIRS